jgi:hypothetical protein
VILKCVNALIFLHLTSGGATSRCLKGLKPVLWLFRAICVLLLLPFLTVAAGPNRLPDAVAISLEASHGAVHARLGGAAHKVAFPQAKRVTVELEDGPEGEEAPTFGLLRAYVGDDLIGNPQSAIRIAFDCSHTPPIADCSAPPRFFIPYDGFPTGPPAA